MKVRPACLSLLLLLLALPLAACGEIPTPLRPGQAGTVSPYPPPETPVNLLAGEQPGPVVAQEEGEWASSLTVVNMGAAATEVTVEFYTDIGSVLHPMPPFQLLPRDSTIIYLPGLGTLPAGLKYSVAVLADQPIATLTNLTGHFGNDHFNGSCSGIEGDSPSW